MHTCFCTFIFILSRKADERSDGIVWKQKYIDRRESKQSTFKSKTFCMFGNIIDE
jgi:hypothetical protein